jgi:CRP-like cAMP-binding protein
MAERPQLAITNFKSGQYIIVEGKTAERFFIIREGQVQLSREAGTKVGDKANLLGPGDFFGVVSTMSSHNHIESAQAISDVVLLSVSRSQFEGLIQFNAPIAIKVIQQFSSRMRYLNDEFAPNQQHMIKVGDKAADEDLTEALFRTGEYYLAKKDNAKAAYSFRRYVACYPKGAFAADCRAKLAAGLEAQASAPETSGFLHVYKKGQFIFADGEPGNTLFIIQKGAVQISKITPKGELIFAMLKAGDMFGEMALLESKPRSANAICYEDCTCMVLALTNFESTAKTQPAIISRLTVNLAERIWYSYKQLANSKITDPLGRMYDLMNMQLEKGRVMIVPKALYQFNFGMEELAKMVGIPDSEIKTAVMKLRDDKNLQIVNGKIVANDMEEIVKLSAHYRRLSLKNQKI